MKALKAFIYFELVRRYGPICLVPQNMPMELDVSAYQLPRQHVDTCFKEIVRLLDEAAPYIPMHNQRDPAYGHTICLEALYALKAKALLYAASPLFNGNAFYSDFRIRTGSYFLILLTTGINGCWLQRLRIRLPRFVPWETGIYTRRKPRKRPSC